MVGGASENKAQCEAIVDIDLGVVDCHSPGESTSLGDIDVCGDPDGIVIGRIIAGKPKIAQRLVEALPGDDDRVSVVVGLGESRSRAVRVLPSRVPSQCSQR